MANTSIPNTQAIGAAIQHAANSTMADALNTYGGSLSDTEKAVLSSMSPSEIKSLASAQAKLGSLGIGGKAMDNNNL